MSNILYAIAVILVIFCILDFCVQRRINNTCSSCYRSNSNTILDLLLVEISKNKNNKINNKITNYESR